MGEPDSLKLFIGLVSFRRNGDHLNLLSRYAEGATGWQAGKAENENRFVQSLRTELGEIGLEVIEVDDIREIANADEAHAFDDHLADNIKRWADGKMTVWGTIHQYIADGEA